MSGSRLESHSWRKWLAFFPEVRHVQGIPPETNWPFSEDTHARLLIPWRRMDRRKNRNLPTTPNVVCSTRSLRVSLFVGLVGGRRAVVRFYAVLHQGSRRAFFVVVPNNHLSMTRLIIS